MGRGGRGVCACLSVDVFVCVNTILSSSLSPRGNYSGGYGNTSIMTLHLQGNYKTSA